MTKKFSVAKKEVCEVKTKTIYTDELMMQNYFFKLLKGTEKKPSTILLAFPFLRWVHSSGNGLYKPRGIERGLAKSNGQTSGVWDVFCPFCSTYIEFKVGTNKLSREQEEFMEENTNFEYRVFNDPLRAYNWVAEQAKNHHIMIKYAQNVALHQAITKSV